jgi:hypothetical protein
MGGAGIAKGGVAGPLKRAFMWAMNPAFSFGWSLT